MITVKNVCKSYVVKDTTKSFFKRLCDKRDRKQVIKELNFSIQKGEIVGYLGENGAGKSTTIKMLLGIIPFDSGEIEVFGKNPFKYRQKNAQHIGVLFGQKSQLWWDLPLEDSFIFLQKIYGCSLVDKQWLDWLIDKLNVRDYVQQPVRELSLGQRMRGEFICSLLHQPELVILDEPTIGLDIETKQKLMEIILKINAEKQTTFLMTSHDFVDVEKICHKIMILNDGKVAYEGSIEDYKKIHDEYKKITVVTTSPKRITVEGIHELSRNVSSVEYYVNETYLSKEDAFRQLRAIYSTEMIEVSDVSFSELTLVKKAEEMR